MEFVRIAREPDALSRLIGDTVTDIQAVRSDAERAELSRIVAEAFDIAYGEQLTPLVDVPF